MTRQYRIADPIFIKNPFEKVLVWHKDMSADLITQFMGPTVRSAVNETMTIIRSNTKLNHLTLFHLIANPLKGGEALYAFFKKTVMLRILSSIEPQHKQHVINLLYVYNVWKQSCGQCKTHASYLASSVKTEEDVNMTETTTTTACDRCCAS